MDVHLTESTIALLLAAERAAEEWHHARAHGGDVQQARDAMTHALMEAVDAVTVDAKLEVA